MRLKNSIFIVILIFTTQLFAQDFSGIRIYINPGHGGHDIGGSADDRYVPQTGFWESDGNLDKGLYLRDILKSMHAIVKMSRITNTSADDLPLSVIDADANNFDADYFHAIHSNGDNGKSNYTLVLYKGTDNNPASPESKKMAAIMAKNIYEAHRTTAEYIHGDKSFLGFYLGVLRTLNMPGTLSEGSFHDYIPESWRLMNTYYRKQEAWSIAQSFIEYYHLQNLKVGFIAGILRDRSEKVSYYSIPGTNDSYLPVNLSVELLSPDKKIFYGDDNNNGFFLFDSVKPGNYALIMNAQYYKSDTVSVSVSANKTSFADRFLTLVPDYNPPAIISVNPSNGSSNLDLTAVINLNFNIWMNKTSVENSFTISPSVNGNFKWSDNDKTVKFIPKQKLSPGTRYEISISTNAESHFGIKMPQSFSSDFTTRSKLNLTYIYPANGQSDISTTVLIKLQFDAGINANSLGNNILFLDKNNKPVPLFVYQSGYPNGLIQFEPSKPLDINSGYKIILKAGIGDVEGLNYGENNEFTFTTEKTKYVSGNILDNFEMNRGWLNPGKSGSSVGIDTNGSTFLITTKRKKDGTHSGEIHYIFTGENGICQIADSSRPVISTNQNSNFGIWVFGDLSRNVLEYWFSYGQSSIAKVFVDTLNWTGWKLESVRLSGINFNGKLALNSVVVKQTEKGALEGKIYLDDAQTNIITPVEQNKTNIPSYFALKQNYPNPFNPTTTIRFLLKVNSKVSLIVYNLLGEKVATLVNGYLSPGYKTVKFNASNFASGVYLYRLIVKGNDGINFISTKKMILLK